MVAEKQVARFVSGHRLSPGRHHRPDSLGRVAWPEGVHPGGGQGPRTCGARSGPLAFAWFVCFGAQRELDWGRYRYAAAREQLEQLGAGGSEQRRYGEA